MVCQVLTLRTFLLKTMQQPTSGVCAGSKWLDKYLVSPCKIPSALRTRLPQTVHSLDWSHKETDDHATLAGFNQLPWAGRMRRSFLQALLCGRPTQLKKLIYFFVYWSSWSRVPAVSRRSAALFSCQPPRLQSKHPRISHRFCRGSLLDYSKEIWTLLYLLAIDGKI